MLNFGDYIPNIAMAIASTWIVRRFWGTFCEKKESTVLSLLAWFLYFVFQAYFQIDAGNPRMITMPLSVALVLNIGVWSYQSTGKEKCFLSVMFCALWLLMETFTLILLIGIPMEHETLNALGTIISKIMMMVLTHTISVFWNKRYDEAVPVRFYLYFLLLPVGSIVMVLNQFSVEGNGSLSTVSVSILLLFNVIFFEIYVKMNELFLQEKENIVHARQSEIILANTQEQKKMIEDFHEEKHNLVNKLVVLKSEAEEKGTEKVIEGINQIINDCQHRESICDSGNSTIDAIINFKYSMAKEYGIEFCLKIAVPEELPIRQQDMGVVLGNALDNAIEAVKECNPDNRRIGISIGIKKDAWVLVMKNPYEHVIEKDRRGRILSSKKEKDRHGYGLKSMIKIAEKYQGDVVINEEKHFFCLTVVLNLGEF
ncbi:MAG: GHKL domain-containing protein [Roseburia sp.]|nr:GHKL domain-containing protein [Roseburia sp.]